MGAISLRRALAAAADDKKAITEGFRHAAIGWFAAPTARALMTEPQTITRAAEDVNFIAKRLKEIKADEDEARKQRDPETATGEHLDRIASDYGIKRAGLTDYGLRQAVKKAMSGEPAGTTNYDHGGCYGC